MQTAKFEVTDDAIDQFNYDGRFERTLERWLSSLTGPDVGLLKFRRFFSSHSNKMTWRDGGPCLSDNYTPILGVENGTLYLRWTRAFRRLSHVYEVVGSDLQGYVNFGTHTKEVPVNCPREFNALCKNAAKVYCNRSHESGTYVLRYYREEAPPDGRELIAIWPYGGETIHVPMRERLGAFLQDKVGASLSVIDEITANIWQELARLSEPPTLDILEGDDVITAYENEVGGESCMTSRTDNIEIYALNPDKVRLATIETTNSSARCLLWYSDCGHVIADRVYTSGSLSSAHMHASLTRHFEGSDLKFVPNRGEGQPYFISNLVLPDSKMLPYLDTAMWREADEAHIDIAINPRQAGGWESQSDYENGGRLAYPEEQCDVCGGYYNPDDDDSSGTLANGNQFCGCCSDNGAVVWVESDSEYYLEDDCRWSAFADSHIHRSNAIYIEDTDEYVHESDMEDWARGRLDDTDLPTSQFIIDAIIQHYRHEQ